MQFNATELSVLESGTQRLGLFFYLATTPAVRIWLGVGDIKPGKNAIDTTGQTYKGFGQLRDIPEFQQLLNGQAERVEFTLSGVSSDILAIAGADDAPNVKAKDCALGFGLLSDDWSQLLANIHWIRKYRADFLSARQELSEDLDQPIIRTVALSVGSRHTGRRRPALSFFTNQDQQRRSADDKFCERTPLYSQDVTKRWPDL